MCVPEKISFYLRAEATALAITCPQELSRIMPFPIPWFVLLVLHCTQSRLEPVRLPSVPAAPGQAFREIWHRLAISDHDERPFEYGSPGCQPIRFVFNQISRSDARNRHNLPT